MGKQRKRYIVPVTTPHPIQGIFMIGAGAAIATADLWLPRPFKEEIDFGAIAIWTMIGGAILAAFGVARAGWRERVVIDFGKKRLITSKGLFGIGKREAFHLADIHSVLIKREVSQGYNSSTNSSYPTVRYPVCFEGPIASVPAGWSGYYEESRKRAVELARLLRVDLRDASGEAPRGRLGMEELVQEPHELEFAEDPTTPPQSRI